MIVRTHLLSFSEDIRLYFEFVLYPLKSLMCNISENYIYILGKIDLSAEPNKDVNES